MYINDDIFLVPAKTSIRVSQGEHGMQLTLKRTLVVVLLVVALLIVLLSGIIRSATGDPGHNVKNSSPNIAANCPGPPFSC